jgi:putative PIN family toxin of toxin-antitoxin system
MRLVVDTNIFASAALKTSSSPASVIRWVDRFGGLLKSEATERQLLDVLQRPYIASRSTPGYFENVRRLLAAAELVVIDERIAACRDPTDDKFLELAVNGKADLIVTGDADLLVLNPFREIPIVAPAVFVAGILRSTKP